LFFDESPGSPAALTDGSHNRLSAGMNMDMLDYHSRRQRGRPGLLIDDEAEQAQSVARSRMVKGQLRFDCYSERLTILRSLCKQSK
jgi:hypothetical protein